MLRAHRNVSKVVGKKEIEGYVNDMRESQEKKQLEDQRNEFWNYLDVKVAEMRQSGKVNEFFLSMHDKMVAGVILTDNMVNALRKCVARDDERTQPVDESKLPVKSFKVKQWWMKQNSLDSRIITGVVLRETSRAYLMKGHADMHHNTSFCVRCGRELTEPASQITGMGETCASKVGIPYDCAGILSATPAQRKKIRESFLAHLHNQQFEAWIPKSQIEDEYEVKPAKAPKKGAKKPAKK